MQYWKWFIVIIVAFWVIAGAYKIGEFCGKVYALKRIPEGIGRAVAKQFIQDANPDTSPIYEDIRKQGYKWVEKRGWVK